MKILERGQRDCGLLMLHELHRETYRLCKLMRGYYASGIAKNNRLSGQVAMQICFDFQMKIMSKQFALIENYCMQQKEDCYQREDEK